MAGTPPRPHTQASPLHPPSDAYSPREDMPPTLVAPEGTEGQMVSLPAYSPLAIDLGRVLYRVSDGGKYE